MNQPATYENSTGAKGQRRRKQAHKAKKDKNMQPTASTHMHGTRADVKNTNKEHSQQTTQATMQAITQLLNYCATHPEATVRYIASNMVLHVESDASYLTAPKAQSCAAGYHFLSSRPQDPTKPPGPNDPPPLSNGAINVLCSIMREVVANAAEAELAALFH
jgi:hypothetical protein